MAVGVGSSSSSMIIEVNMGDLDGTSTLRFELPYSVNISPASYIGVFIPERY